MIVGKVIGNIISTKKIDALKGCKFLRIEPLNQPDNVIVAVDRVGAGIGEIVLVTQGHNSQFAFLDKKLPVDAVVIGIVD